jgi:hypothetical protein
MITVCYSVVALLGLIYPAILLWRLTRPKVRAAFAPVGESVGPASDFGVGASGL